MIGTNKKNHRHASLKAIKTPRKQAGTLPAKVKAGKWVKFDHP
jgi:hypothetical protein